MKAMQSKVAWFAVTFLLLAVCAKAQTHPPVKPDPNFDKMKTLAGDWEGTMDEGGKSYPAHAVVTVIADGSVVMHQLDPGGKYNMVTMIHQDGHDLLATHYCAAHNQPRMKLTPSDDPATLLFVFMDGTNIGPGDSHMQSVKFVFVDADHHYEDWSSIDNGKVTTGRFDFHRKKA